MQSGECGMDRAGAEPTANPGDRTVPHSGVGWPDEAEATSRAAGNECGRRGLPPRPGWRAALPPDPRLLSKLGVSQGPPRARRAPRARREVAEETGLKDLVLHGPIRVIDWYFRFRGKTIHKFCHFFLFESRRGECVPQMEEGITDCAWYSSVEARRTISYDNAREVLEQASAMVQALAHVVDDAAPEQSA